MRYVIAQLYAAYRRQLLLSVAHDDGDARLQFHQAFGGRNRLVTEHALQIAPDQDHESQVGDGIEIHFADGAVRDGHIERINVGDGEADGDRHIHGEMTAAQTAQRTAEEGVAGIQQCRRRQRQAHPVEELAELILIGAAVQRDGDPQHVHHGKAGEEQAEQHGAVGFLDRALRAFRVVGHGRVADLGQRPDQIGKFAARVIPTQMQTLRRQIHVGGKHARCALQAALDEPYAGGAVDAFNQQMDIANIAGTSGEFLLNLIEVVDFDVFGRSGGRS